MRRRSAVAVLACALLSLVGPACSMPGAGGGDPLLCGGLTQVAGACIENPAPAVPTVPAVP